MTKRTATLFDTLEHQAQQSLDEIAHLRRQLAALEAENSRLREALQPREVLQHNATAEPAPTPPATVESGSEKQGEARRDASESMAEPRRADDNTAAPSSPDTHRPDDRETPSPQALLGEWYQRYPQTFFKGHTRPLKIGIHEDLASREPWSGKLIRRALACYVHLPRYLKAVREGVERVDLDGQPAGTINEEEARHARQQMEGLQAKQRNSTRERQQATQAKQKERKDASLDRKLNELLARHGRK